MQPTVAQGRAEGLAVLGTDLKDAGHGGAIALQVACPSTQLSALLRKLVLIPDLAVVY